MNNQERTDYLTREYRDIIGKTVDYVRPLTQAECANMAWEYDCEYEACVIVFTDGTAVTPMRDTEGNGAGFLAVGKLVTA